MTAKLSAFCEALLISIQTVVNTGNAAAPWQVHTQTATHTEPDISPVLHLSVELTFSGALAGVLALSLPQAIAPTLLGEESPDYRELWLAMIRSVGEHLCATLSVAVPSAITLEACASSNVDQRLEPFCAFELTSFVAEAPVAILVSANKVLLAQLQAQPAPPSAAHVLGSSAAPLHRVIDVPLAVTLRFGQRHLTLREVLDLNPGSLLELDRHVEEPVDLMLGDRIIARGEVVIIDGNYGMRVTEVVELPTHTLGVAPKPSAFAYTSA